MQFHFLYPNLPLPPPPYSSSSSSPSSSSSSRFSCFFLILVLLVFLLVLILLLLVFLLVLLLLVLLLLLRSRLLLTLLWLAFRKVTLLTLHIVQICASDFSGVWTRPWYQLLFMIFLSTQSDVETKGTSGRLRQIPFTTSPIHSYQYLYV